MTSPSMVSSIVANKLTLLHGLAIGVLTGGVIVVAAVLFLAVRGIYGYHAQVILSGSMYPALPVGSIIITRREPPAEYQKGDIITFTAPIKSRILVTHRIAKEYVNQYGLAVVETKGDANTNGDTWVVSRGAIIGREVLVIPWMGYGIEMLKTTFGFLVFSLISFLFFVYAELRYVLRYIFYAVVKDQRTGA